MENWLFHRFEPTKIVFTIIREKPELIHFPFYAENNHAKENILVVRVKEYDYDFRKNKVIVDGYIEDNYYIGHLYELLNKWGIYMDENNSRWVMGQ